jgi:hypothetical protein
VSTGGLWNSAPLRASVTDEPPGVRLDGKGDDVAVRPGSDLDFLLTKAFEERSDISIRDGAYSGTATLIGRDEDSDRPGIVCFRVTWDVVEHDDDERTRMECLSRAR